MWKRLRKLARKILERVAVPVLQKVQQWEEDRLPQFATTPRNLTIRMPRTIRWPERISIGDDV